jgi:predicted enzyme related to lactoylglutathione lyase
VARARDGYPAGVPCWVDTAQPDPTAAVAFYGGLFGWTFVDRTPAGEPGRYEVAHLDGGAVAAVSSLPPGAPPATPTVWTTYVMVDAADDAVTRAVAAGGEVVAGPFDVGDAGRTAVITDPAGAPLALWQAGRHRGAAVVNEPGSWNWSNLTTPDPEGAAAFYGAMFGWEATDMGGGMTMWRLPGYAEFLEGFDPDLRRRHAEDGVPAGFSDAVGWMAAGAGPAQWGVTFAVDDTDAAAARAAELGGTILVPPFDADVVRMAVVRDPQGAELTLSRYAPG